MENTNIRKDLIEEFRSKERLIQTAEGVLSSGGFLKNIFKTLTFYTGGYFPSINKRTQDDDNVEEVLLDDGNIDDFVNKLKAEKEAIYLQMTPEEKLLVESGEDV